MLASEDTLKKEIDEARQERRIVGREHNAMTEKRRKDGGDEGTGGGGGRIVYGNSVWLSSVPRPKSESTPTFPPKETD